MVGALSVVGSSAVDSHTCPCLCLDAVPTTNMSFRSVGDSISNRNLIGRKRLVHSGSIELSSSFLDSWQDWRMSAKSISGFVNMSCRKQKRGRRIVIVDELAGQYEDSFEDVKKQILNLFTYKAVRTVLNQLYEMNPTQYRWFYDFVVTNKPGDGKRFLRKLVKVVIKSFRSFGWRSRT